MVEQEKTKIPVVAVVTSAVALNEEQRLKLSGVLSKKQRRPVELTLKTDEAVIGGLSIYVNGLLIDNTVKKQLQEMKTSITRSLRLE